jgi:hypothetical protein
MKGMSMYVELLSNYSDGWREDLTGSDLLEYAVNCRAEMLSSGPAKGGSAYSALALELGYDRALIRMCTTKGIDALAADFAHPRQARTHLEQELAGAGIDLAGPNRRKSPHPV